MAGFAGMRGTGSWADDQRPKNWREGILYLYPNGMAPLTAILSMLKNEAVTDPEYYWWTKDLSTQRAAVTGIYTDALSSAYVSGGSAGDDIWLKMSADGVSHFRVGHQVLIRDASDFTLDVNAKVTARAANGASSYIKVSLLEDDDNSDYGHDLSDADVVMVIGNINEEGAEIPASVSYDPTKLYNYTQIFRTPLKITRTARKTKLRTGDAYKELKREALELHSIEMEKAFLFGFMYETTGDGGYPERSTEGIINTLRRLNSGNVVDFSLNASYDGKSWLDDGGGEDFLDNYLELLFRYGSTEKIALCGSGALLGINKLAKAGAHMQLTPTTKSYGIQVTEWITPFGTINLKTHPLMSAEATLRNGMLILDPKNIKYRYIDDTQFYAEGEAKKAGPGTQGSRVDATTEEFLTEAGLELHHPYTHMYLNGIGQDNS